MRCGICKKELKVYGNKIGFRDTCPHCLNELHICLNCKFYEPGRYNDCSENSADRVIDKERANKCDFFMIRD